MTEEGGKEEEEEEKEEGEEEERWEPGLSQWARGEAGRSVVWSVEPVLQTHSGGLCAPALGKRKAESLGPLLSQWLNHCTLILLS